MRRCCGRLSGQQVSVASARAIWARLEAAGLTEAAGDGGGLGRGPAGGGPVAAEGALWPGAGAGGDRLRRPCAALPDAEVVATLVAVPGIGVWTAEIYAMFALGRADVFAPGDLALQEAARLLFGLDARPDRQGAAGDGRGLVALAVGCGARPLGLLPGRKGPGRGLVMRELRFGRKGRGRRQGALVVFLHGYGADGADLLGLADVLGPHLPGVAFLAPDAPERCVGGGFGYQWFPIPWLDGSPQAAAEAGLDAAAGDLNGFLDARLAEEGLTPDRLVLVGFSQGAMMSLHVAPRRPAGGGGGGGDFGPAVAARGACRRDHWCKPPVLLMHGDQDPVVPFEDMGKAGHGAGRGGVATYGHVMKGTGHGIAPDGLGVALQFLKERLGSDHSGQNTIIV